jgi:hypothetical protein
LAIDVTEPWSPGWWMARLSTQLTSPKRLRRLRKLDRYAHGDPELPQGADNAREAFAAFQRKARSNFAELIVQAVRERMTLVGFRTGADDDETGDARATGVWQAADMAVVSADVHDLMLSLGEAYAIAGPIDDDTGVPLVTAESPLQMIGVPDPARPRRLRAALKMFYDDLAEEQLAYLYLPGQVHVAALPGRRTADALDRFKVRFNPNTWTLDPARSGGLGHDRMPVVPFNSKDGEGEFENHLDLLDRINHQILQRMVIATMQAFRQRAVKGLPKYDEQGVEIDYADVFVADPAAMWQLPEAAEMWESGQIDLTPILSAVKDDVVHLSAVSRTPMHMLQPEGANQSAEGASLAREGLVFKVEDRIDRVSSRWAQVVALMFTILGDTDRANLTGITPLWRPPDRPSLAERADAASKAQDIPWRTRMIRIWGFTPGEVDRMEAERADDQLLAAQVAAASPAPSSAAGRTTAPAALPAPQPAPAEPPAPGRTAAA